MISHTHTDSDNYHIVSDTSTATVAVSVAVSVEVLASLVWINTAHCYWSCFPSKLTSGAARPCVLHS